MMPDHFDRFRWMSLTSLTWSRFEHLLQMSALEVKTLEFDVQNFKMKHLAVVIERILSRLVYGL